MSLGFEFADVCFRVVFDLGFAFAAANADFEVGSLLFVCVFAADRAFALFGFGDFFSEGDRVGIKLGLALFAAEGDGDFDYVVFIDCLVGNRALFIYGTGEGGKGGEAERTNECCEEFHDIGGGGLFDMAT